MYLYMRVCELIQYLRARDRNRTDAGIDGGPGARGDHAGKQGVQVSSSQSQAVAFHPRHVTFYQSLPKPTIVQPEGRLKDLEGEMFFVRVESTRLIICCKLL